MVVILDGAHFTCIAHTCIIHVHLLRLVVQACAYLVGSMFVYLHCTY